MLDLLVYSLVGDFVGALSCVGFIGLFFGW